MDLSPKEQRKLEKVLETAVEGELTTIEQVFAVEDRVDALEEVIPSLATKEEVSLALSEIELQKGDQGEKGEDGLDGLDGEDGETPIKNVDYFDGKDGRDGIDGINGLDGKDGVDGLPGKDGSPDTPDQVVDKVNESTKLIKRERVEGMSDIERLAKANNFDFRIGVSKTEVTQISNRVTTLEGQQIIISADAPSNPNLHALWIDLA